MVVMLNLTLTHPVPTHIGLYTKCTEQQSKGLQGLHLRATRQDHVIKMLILPIFYLFCAPFCSLVQLLTDMGPPVSPSDETYRYHKTPNTEGTKFSSGSGWLVISGALVIMLSSVLQATATTISRVKKWYNILS